MSNISPITKRPPSYSEGFIEYADKNCSKQVGLRNNSSNFNITNITVHNHLPAVSSPVGLEIESPIDPTLSDTRTNTIRKKIKQFFAKHSEKLIFTYKRSIIYTAHISLIIMFEIIFFFEFVSSYAVNLIFNLINVYISKAQNICSTIPDVDKTIITDIFDYFVNMNTIYNDAQTSSRTRNAENTILFRLAWAYFSCLLSVSIILYLLNYKFKIKMNIKKMVFDNIVMIIFLGISEYIFFVQIVFNYASISANELSYYIIQNLSGTCLILQ